jgi:hypothetical protein
LLKLKPKLTIKHKERKIMTLNQYLKQIRDENIITTTSGKFNRWDKNQNPLKSANAYMDLAMKVKSSVHHVIKAGVEQDVISRRKKYLVQRRNKI